MNFRKNLVHVITASPGPLRVGACDRRIVLDPGALSVASRIDHHDARRRERKTVCADLVALSCELVSCGSPPLRAPVR